MYNYRPPMKLREGNVLGRFCYFPWCIAPHCTGTPPALVPSPRDMRLYCTGTLPYVHATLLCREPLAPAPLQTWDLTIQSHIHLRTLHQCWHLVAIEACRIRTSGRYTSYWNAFLFRNALNSMRDLALPSRKTSKLQWNSRPSRRLELHSNYWFGRLDSLATSWKTYCVAKING